MAGLDRATFPIPVSFPLAALLMSVSAAAHQYRFYPGQRFEFQQQEVAPASPAFSYEFWVAGAENGNYRIVGHLIPAGEPNYVDVDPQGTVRYRSADLNQGYDAADFFPQLPRANELGSGWHRFDEKELSWTDYQIGMPDLASTLALVGIRRGSLNTAYGIVERSDFSFDPSIGAVTRISRYFHSTYPSVKEFLSTVSLVSNDRMNSFDPGLLGEEAEIYTRARNAYARNVDSAYSLPVGQAEKALRRAKTILIEARSRLSLALFTAKVADLLKGLQSETPLVLASAKDLGSLIGTPAPPWESPDLNGKVISSADLTGRVTVLDFWFRGCHWCMASIPHLERLVVRFAGQPVAWIGMNIDQKIEDPEFIVRSFGIKYPVLPHAETIASKFHVNGYPSFVILDKKGVLRFYHAGFDLALEPTMIEEIHELLKE